MKVTVIAGSPKPSGGASEFFAREMMGYLDGAEASLVHWSKNGAEGLEAAASSGALVFVFPLYVDGIPSHLLEQLREAEDSFRGLERPPRVYALVNCGFHEGGQTRLALENLRHWCARAGLPWGMGVGVGGGPMLHTPGVPKATRRSLEAALRALASALLSGEGAADRFTGPDFPRRLYTAMAHMGFRNDAKRNGLKRRDLYRRAGS